MSLQKIYAQLAQLPFADMMELASKLSERLESDEHTPESVANDLVKMAIANLSSMPASASADEDALRKVFSRKRTVTIRLDGSGYVVNLPTIPSSAVIGPDLRAALGYMLDQTIAHHVMTGGKVDGRK